jgi:hypothetical protein
VDCGQTAAALDEALKRRLLFLVQDVARSAEEDDPLVFGEVCGSEPTGVLGRNISSVKHDAPYPATHRHNENC